MACTSDKFRLIEAEDAYLVMSMLINMSEPSSASVGVCLYEVPQSLCKQLHDHGNLCNSCAELAPSCPDSESNSLRRKETQKLTCVTKTSDTLIVCDNHL